MRRIVSILAALAVLVSLSALTWRLRRAHKDVAEVLEGGDRYRDMGVVLNVVVRDDENGIEYLRGKPKLRILRKHDLGGMIDTSASPPALVGKSESPIHWYCSEISEPFILHGEDLPPNICVEGAMGGGKTTDLGQWLYVRAMDLTGTNGDIGATAPTGKRLKTIIKAIRDMWPKTWWKWKARDQAFVLANGITLELVSTHQASEAEGSQIQGQSWLACASDELQDSIPEDGNIEARGRDAPEGVYRRFATCTVKDNPDYRDWKGHAKSAKDDDADGGQVYWHFVTKKGQDSPFVPPKVWARYAKTMSLREYQRKVLAMDLPPEGLVYHGWDRERNLRPLQQVPPWPDVTARELARWGRGYEVLVGFDPGRLFDVSVLLKAYQPSTPRPTRERPNPAIPDPVWFVVGEVTTEQSTTEHHCRALLKVLREQFGCNLTSDGPQAFVRGDPATTTGKDEEQPDLTVFTVFHQHGIHAKAAAYAIGSVKHGRVPKEARIDMVNTLFCSADNNVRLVVQCDDRKLAKAPKLVDALESLERDGDGRAERDRKNRNDKTHWPCALGYALWSIEKPRLDGRRSA